MFHFSEPYFDGVHILIEGQTVPNNTNIVELLAPFRITCYSLSDPGARITIFNTGLKFGPMKPLTTCERVAGRTD